MTRIQFPDTQGTAVGPGHPVPQTPPVSPMVEETVTDKERRTEKDRPNDAETRRDGHSKAEVYTHKNKEGGRGGCETETETKKDATKGDRRRGKERLEERKG